jgi:diaminopimelate decarboxylase
VPTLSSQGRVLLRPTAAVAEKMSGSSSQFSQPAGKGLGFYTGEDGYLYCDNMRVDDIRHQVS